MGAISLGLSTTVQPAASAGAALRVIMATGKFHGVTSTAALAHILPHVREETARRAVALRDADGPYKNAEEFRYRLGLSMEVLGRIGPKISTLHTPVTRWLRQSEPEK